MITVILKYTRKSVKLLESYCVTAVSDSGFVCVLEHLISWNVLGLASC